MFLDMGRIILLLGSLIDPNKNNEKRSGFCGCDNSPTINDNLQLSVREKWCPSDAGPKLSAHIMD